VTENHLGHPLQEIEIVHQKRHKVISDTVKEIHNLQLSKLLEQEARVDSIFAVCVNTFSLKLCLFFLYSSLMSAILCCLSDKSDSCRLCISLLNSNDTRRFIGGENSNIVKAFQGVIQNQTPSNIKRASFIVKKKVDSRQIGTLIGTLQFPSFDFPDHQSSQYN
jgi:hypothetical protein